MAEFINATDSLNEGRKKLNAIAKEMNDKEVASMPEVVSARDGHPNLRARLDEEYQAVISQIARDAISAQAGLDKKVDINGSQQVKYSNLDQQIREMFTGGNTAVVGPNSVGTDNVINGSILYRKLYETFRFDGGNVLGGDTDLNDLKKEGNYVTTAAVANKPEGHSTAVVLVFALNPNFTFQIYVDINNRLFWRMHAPNAPTGWRPWEEAATNDKIDKLKEEIDQAGTIQLPYLTDEDDLDDYVDPGRWIAINPIGNPIGSHSLMLEVKTFTTVDGPANAWGYQMASSIHNDDIFKIRRFYHRRAIGETTFHPWADIAVGTGSGGTAQPDTPLSDSVIVNLGDSIFGNTRGSTSVSQAIANRTGAEVINIGFGGSRVAQHATSFDPFSLYRLADEIVKDDTDATKWELQDDRIQKRQNGQISGMPAYFDQHLEDLKNIDFNEVNILTIAGGTNDYTAGVSLDNGDNPKDTVTFGGALRYSLEKIMGKYKHLKVLICSPMYRFWLEDGQFLDDSDTRTYNDQYLIDFVKKAQEVGEEYKIPVLDNYTELGINKFNRQEYFSGNDGTHPNPTGNKKLGHKIGSALISEF